MNKFYYIILFLLISCEKQKHSYDGFNNCWIECFEKENEAPVYITRCTDIVQMYGNEDEIKVTYAIKNNKHLNTYEPFEKIYKNKENYYYCRLNIKGRKAFR